MLGLTADTIPLFVATISVPYKEPGSGWCFVPGIPQVFVAKVTKVSVLEISHILTKYSTETATCEFSLSRSHTARVSYRRYPLIRLC